MAIPNHQHQHHHHYHRPPPQTGRCAGIRCHLTPKVKFPIPKHISGPLPK